MARLARADVFDPLEVSAFHCINRCVRRSFLCGEDPLTHANYDHRKAWLEQRLKFLAGQFGIDVLGFAIMSNHFHIILRNRPDVVSTWSDTEVATRWLRICPGRMGADGQSPEPKQAAVDALAHDRPRLETIRRRLSDISWLMAKIAEPIARWANKEDQATGRFWEGRYRAVKLCVEAALLACAAYVDLNPVRSGLVETPEASDFTSVQRRIESLPKHGMDSLVATEQRADGWLSPIDLGEATAAPGPLASKGGRRASDKGFLPITLSEYLKLLDWTGRQFVFGRGWIPAHLPPILQRLGIAESDWLPLVTGFGRLFHRVAGAPRTLVHIKQPTSFRPGAAQLLGSAPQLGCDMSPSAVH